MTPPGKKPVASGIRTPDLPLPWTMADALTTKPARRLCVWVRYSSGKHCNPLLTPVSTQSSYTVCWFVSLVARRPSNRYSVSQAWIFSEKLSAAAALRWMMHTGLAVSPTSSTLILDQRVRALTRNARRPAG